jgi:hypothetical protein
MALRHAGALTRHRSCISIKPISLLLQQAHRRSFCVTACQVRACSILQCSSLQSAVLPRSSPLKQRRSICSTAVRRSGGGLYSSGTIFQPYAWQDLRLRAPVYTLQGIKQRLVAYKGHLKSGASSGFIEKHVPEFKVKHMPQIADDVFEKFLDAHRKGDLSGLSYHATEGLYQNIAAELAAAKKKGAPPRRAFRLLGMKESTYVLQMRYAMRKVIELFYI